MKQVNVVALLTVVTRNGQNFRFNLTVVLENKIKAEQSFSQNFNNLELTPTRPLTLGDVQHLLKSKVKCSFIKLLFYNKKRSKFCFFLICYNFFNKLKSFFNSWFYDSSRITFNFIKREEMFARN